MGTSASTRWLVGFAATIVAVVVVSVAVALAVERGVEEYPADTPEGAVQRYLQAIIDRDAEAALSYLSPELLERCEQADQLQNLRSSIRFAGDREMRAALLDTREAGEETQVEVRITEVYGDPPFGRDEYSHEHLFVLQQFDGEWRFSEPPWPLWGCPTPRGASPALPVAR